MKFGTFFEDIGINKNSNLVVHSSLKSLKSVYPDLNPELFISELLELIGPAGSLIMPTFTYCWDFKETTTPFNPDESISKSGALTEVFRKIEGVKRTLSPTHSFVLFGKICNDSSILNSPVSPLGDNSVMDWIYKHSESSSILLLGVNFRSLSFLHYLEIHYKVPWYDLSPWDHLNVPSRGLSITGSQDLIQLPGCSKGFLNFQKYFLAHYPETYKKFGSMNYFIIPLNNLLKAADFYFTNNFSELLCPAGTCKPCDERRMKLGWPVY